MSELLSYARKELDILNAAIEPDDESVIKDFEEEILAIVKKFENMSGFEAHVKAAALASTIKNLCLFKPLTSLKGTDDEWLTEETGGKTICYNSRCTGVFKDIETGNCEYIDAIIWEVQSEDDNTFTGHVALADADGKLHNTWSFRKIKGFPFVPKTFYVRITPAPEHGQDVYVANAEDLKLVNEYYGAE
jgi:hypothetical protein